MERMTGGLDVPLKHTELFLVKLRPSLFGLRASVEMVCAPPFEA
jgi:hypothetical protein